MKMDKIRQKENIKIRMYAPLRTCSQDPEPSQSQRPPSNNSPLQVTQMTTKCQYLAYE